MSHSPPRSVATTPSEAAVAAVNDEEANADGDIDNSSRSSRSHRAAPSVSMSIANDPSTTTNDDDDHDDDQDVDPRTQISPTALANAEHLDRLEASDAHLDIASFHDIELPKNETSPPNNDDDEEDRRPPSDPSGIRRAKRYYYCLPVLIRYKYALAGCFLLFWLVITAISLSASLYRNNRAIAAAEMAEGGRGRDGEGDQGEMVINDAPGGRPDYDDNQSYEPYGDWYGDGDDQGDMMEEVVSDPPFHSEGVSGGWQSSQAGGEEESGPKPREDGDGEELGDPQEASATDPPTDAPRPSPSPITLFPTERLPTGPEWYSTDGSAYETFRESEEDATGSLVNSHALAIRFCADRGRVLCSYEQYCPNGEGSDPYAGAPDTERWNTLGSIERAQWAPMYNKGEIDAMALGEHWVQVGSIPDDQEGTENNDYGKCWSWARWNPGGMDVEVQWGEDNRRWILCCEKEN